MAYWMHTLYTAYFKSSDHHVRSGGRVARTFFKTCPFYSRNVGGNFFLNEIEEIPFNYKYSGPFFSRLLKNLTAVLRKVAPSSAFISHEAM